MAISRKETHKPIKSPPPAPAKKNGKDHGAATEEFPLVSVMREDGSVDDAAMPKDPPYELMVELIGPGVGPTKTLG